MIDLGAELREALLATAPALAEAFRPIIADEVRRALEARDSDRLLDARALADFLGITPAALRMRLARGSELAGIAVQVDGRRMWRRSDVEALVRREPEGSKVVSLVSVPAGGGGR